ncbi:PqqD family protein [Hespellia stercorisuis]|uniref:Coenzyme PQQ synthesis protein D (PqqD) n=1 Tax=Hespellia stercorisuis DSM 15480 TaxID=1121950 RepID=A0A1M6U9U7_9FIRM|nr:PqqD family protein [Hespellia stercorisuis]SHK66035.1 Coenzyme PQQ synthesis protein D (PqqD) [Hespellia stercorisuis DSM 15480]
MKLNSDFITHNTGEEQVMVATGSTAFAGLVRNNKTAAFIVELLKEETTLEQIVDAVFAKYDAPRDVIEQDVRKIIDSLKGIGAING